MIPRKSRILTKLSEGSSCSCLKINLSDPRVVEICGLSGIDAVWICGEHVANDWLNLENQIRAARVHRMDALVRVPKGSYSDYIKPLEAGANGIIVPNVTTAEEAKQIVQMTRFHPRGTRALDGGNYDGAFATIPVEEYIGQSNETQLVILQIESPEGIENLDAIAAVEGYNFLFFGPGDYSHKIGMPGQLDHEEIHKARQAVLEAARKNGKYVITTGVSLENSLESPPQVYITGSDVIALGEYCQKRQNAFLEGSGVTPTRV